MLTQDDLLDINVFMSNIIEKNTVYTSEETQFILKISESTFKRYVKKGIIRAAKIGGQYRVLGKHLLELFDEGTQTKAKNVYRKTKRKVKSWE
jgi:hypothetical protein